MIDATQARRAMAPPRPIRVHLTNVAGLGAVQLVSSLLPALESCDGYRVETLYLPDRGELNQYRPVGKNVRVQTMRRILPNSASRLLECFYSAAGLDGALPLLVLGDLPLRCKARQTVFVQTPLLTSPDEGFDRNEGFRHRVARAVFRANIREVSAAIVQTDVMRIALEGTYPSLRGRVHVVGQPVPNWLLHCDRSSNGKRQPMPGRMRLFYPAAGYPHKNHRLLAGIDSSRGGWPVESLVLTIDRGSHPNPAADWIHCVGRLDANGMQRAYREADGLVFLSLSESYGFPLVEAMWLGLPVICPDLPYARWLCGEPAVYFDPTDLQSLHLAVKELDARLRGGWRPDWSASVARLPRDWASVARSVLDIAAG